MGKAFKSLEAEEAGGSLDGVHGAKDFGNEGGVLGPLLEVGQAALHAVEPFLALDQEFSGQFIRHVCHPARPWRFSSAGSTYGVYRMDRARLEKPSVGRPQAAVGLLREEAASFLL